MRQNIPVVALPPALVVTPTSFEEGQTMARIIDWQRQKEDPSYQGAFHRKKSTAVTKKPYTSKGR
jgi:ATP-dependent RNA helicase RhlE